MPAIRLVRSVLVVHQRVLPCYREGRGPHKYPRRSVRLSRLAAISQDVDNARNYIDVILWQEFCNHVTLLTCPASSGRGFSSDITSDRLRRYMYIHTAHCTTNDCICKWVHVYMFTCPYSCTYYRVLYTGVLRE